MGFALYKVFVVFQFRHFFHDSSKNEINLFPSKCKSTLATLFDGNVVVVAVAVDETGFRRKRFF